MKISEVVQVKDVNDIKNLGTNRIVEVVFEVIFKANDASYFEVLIGECISKAKELGYTKIVRHPINDLPELVKNSPELVNKPRWTLEGDKYILQVGPSVILVSCRIDDKNKYPGWSEFKCALESVINDVLPILSVGVFLRIGMRYINFFKDENIFSDDNLTIGVAMNGNAAEGKHNIQTKFQLDDYGVGITLSNDVSMTVGPSIGQRGSLIDIDVYREGEILTKGVDLSAISNKAHELVKKSFFSLISERFIAKLNK